MALMFGGLNLLPSQPSHPRTRRATGDANGNRAALSRSGDRFQGKGTIRLGGSSTGPSRTSILQSSRSRTRIIGDTAYRNKFFDNQGYLRGFDLLKKFFAVFTAAVFAFSLTVNSAKSETYQESWGNFASLKLDQASAVAWCMLTSFAGLIYDYHGPNFTHKVKNTDDRYTCFDSLGYSEWVEKECKKVSLTGIVLDEVFGDCPVEYSVCELKLDAVSSGQTPTPVEFPSRAKVETAVEGVTT